MVKAIPEDFECQLRHHHSGTACHPGKHRIFISETGEHAVCPLCPRFSTWIRPHRSQWEIQKSNSPLTAARISVTIGRFGELTSAPVLPRTFVRTGWGPAPRFDQDLALEGAWASPKQFTLALFNAVAILPLSVCGSRFLVVSLLSILADNWVRTFVVQKEFLSILERNIRADV